MTRPWNKHLDNQELDALVPSCKESGEVEQELAPDEWKDARHHVSLCLECSSKLDRYRQVLERISIAGKSPGSGQCPEDYEVDWFEVAAGLWPQTKASQLMMHAALCDHCGPLLRAAAQLNQEATAEEEKVLSQLRRLSSPDRGRERLFHGWSMKRLVPALAAMVIAVAVGTIVLSPGTSISGREFAHLALDAHQQYSQGRLALELHSDSEQELNEWLKAKSDFAVSLPVSPPLPGEERPYQLEGARLVKVGRRRAAFIAFQAQGTTANASNRNSAVSLMIISASAVVASGGMEVAMNKLHFHYAMFEPYKVVTWSQHGLTYALVSQDGHSSQRSCMVCHSAIRDRVLSRAPGPLQVERNAMEPRLQ